MIISRSYSLFAHNIGHYVIFHEKFFFLNSNPVKLNRATLRFKLHIAFINWIITVSKKQDTRSYSPMTNANSCHSQIHPHNSFTKRWFPWHWLTFFKNSQVFFRSPFLLSKLWYQNQNHDIKMISKSANNVLFCPKLYWTMLIIFMHCIYLLQLLCNIAFT